MTYTPCVQIGFAKDKQRINVAISRYSSVCISENPSRSPRKLLKEKEFLIDNILVRIHSIIQMILVDQSCAMGG